MTAHPYEAHRPGTNGGAFAARVLLKESHGSLPEAAALTASSNSREATPLL